jgi:hypothetical protein
MAENQESSNVAPIQTVTPLYNFSSDVDTLEIGRGIRISRYDIDDLTDQVDEEVGKHLQVHEPDYLLWHDPLISRDIFADEFLSLLEEQKVTEIAALYLLGTKQLIQTMTLFNSQRLRAGETFVVSRDVVDPYVTWTTVATGRASMMVIDYSFIAAQTTHYVLNSTEIMTLASFRENLLPVLRKINLFPAGSLALDLYSAENRDEQDAIGAITALEALLTKKEETEGLTYRLSMRTANLLGRDAESRKQIFRDVKSFYHLRSKLVHGVQLDPKMLNQLRELYSLRETLRKVLLSALALFAEEEGALDLPTISDELAFDEQKRTAVQARASQFLTGNNYPHVN